jgi:hypothetical protein
LNSYLPTHNRSREYFRQLVDYIIRIALRPGTTAKALLEDKSPLSYGVGATLLIGIMYTITVFFGYINGFGAVVEPWLPIPAENYYFWELFFVIPVYFTSFITASGTMQLLALGFGGSGTFEDTFTIVALGSILPTLGFMWLPETAMMALFPELRAQSLGGFAGIPMWLDIVRQLLVPVWTTVIYVIAMRRIHSVSGAISTIIVLLGMVPSVVITLVFVR